MTARLAPPSLGLLENCKTFLAVLAVGLHGSDKSKKWATQSTKVAKPYARHASQNGAAIQQQHNVSGAYMLAYISWDASKA